MSALLLFGYNKFQDLHAGQEAELLLDELCIAIGESDGTLSDEMPIVMIDGYEYIGYLVIPDLDLKLPVMADWDYNRLELAPCRHFGSSRTDDLVIAAHNYKTHFGSLTELEMGAEIIFVDMEGIENRYALQMRDTFAPDDVSAIRDSDFDLVLYTCDYRGSSRIAAFFDRTDGEVMP